jgi:uncharacterized protein YndB with AHSA1/START domain
MIAPIHKEIVINAPVSAVWQSITDISLMTKWMGGEALQLEVVTNWEIGSPIIVRGFHHARFENSGIVLAYIPDQIVSYNFLSSLSRLPDVAENHTILRFTLAPQVNQTLVTLTISNFPTETIYQHLNFYWNGTLAILKRIVEG